MEKEEFVQSKMESTIGGGINDTGDSIHYPNGSDAEMLMMDDMAVPKSQ